MLCEEGRPYIVYTVCEWLELVLGDIITEPTPTPIHTSTPPPRLAGWLLHTDLIAKEAPAMSSRALNTPSEPYATDRHRQTHKHR